MRSFEKYKGLAFRGNLNLNNDFVIRSITHCAETSLNDPVPENFIGKFLYFYMDRPKIKNPITCCVGRKIAVIHPGQGRVLAAFFRKQPSIDTVFILRNHDPVTEIEKIKEIAVSFEKSKSLLFQYGRNVSTINFQDYYDLNSRVTQKYMRDIRDAIVRYMPQDLLPIKWEFDSAKQIILGQGEIKTLIKCKDALGFYESIIHITDDKNLLSDRFKIS